MKDVLIVHDNPYQSDSPYFRVLIDEIKNLDSEFSIDYGIDKFWNNECFDFRIIHIQFPHFLLLNKYCCKDLESRLIEIKNRNIKIVATCHNILPHYKKEKDLNESYDLVYKYCDEIYHLEEFSFRKLQNKYPSVSHKLLFHPVYDSIYKFFPTKEESFAHLQLKQQSKKYILCIGAFRDDEERNLVIYILKQFRDIIIMAPSFFKIKYRRNLFIVVKDLIKFICYKFFFPRVIFSGRSVSDSELPFYFGASDIAFVHRIKILNSGFVPLSYLFGKVVVGPDTGNVGCILRKTNNFVFSPTDYKQTLVQEIEKALQASKNNLGTQNKEFALKYWNQKKIANEQLNFYKNLLGAD